LGDKQGITTKTRLKEKTVFIKGILYARLEWNPTEPTELMYPLENWDNSPDMPQMSIATFNYGTQPSMRRVTYTANPEESAGRLGNTIRFVRATDDHIFYMLNMWNDSGRFGWVGQWVQDVKQRCPELDPYEIARLERLGKKGRYWTAPKER
jgi:hypothetical protein